MYHRLRSLGATSDLSHNGDANGNANANGMYKVYTSSIPGLGNTSWYVGSNDIRRAAAGDKFKSATSIANMREILGNWCTVALSYVQLSPPPSPHQNITLR